jgi:uncharacterized membrane protein YesL
MIKPIVTNPFSREDWLDRVITLAAANMLWLMCSGPLVTLPAATAGLCATLAPWWQGENPELFQTFFPAMRRFWRQSSLIGLLDAALLGLAGLNLWILSRADSLLAWPLAGVSLFVGLTVLLVNLYFWMLLVTTELPFRPLITISIKLAFVHPLRSILGLIAGALPLALGFFWLPQIVVFLGIFSIAVLLASGVIWPVLLRYRRELFDTD